MAQITFAGNTYAAKDGETVLDALLRHGVEVAHSCRAGACQSCLMRAVTGSVPAAARKGLRETLAAQGYFLACSAKPEQDVTVALPGTDAGAARAVVRRVERLTASVARVRVACDDPFDYRPGQFLNLVRGDGLARSYSIASLPGRDDLIELHVRKVPGGRMSAWLYDDAPEGEAVQVRGPAGSCFYVPGRPEQPILLAGTGTGLAPLYAILQDALRHGHTGPIALYQGAVTADGLYLVSELERLTAEHKNVTYTRCLLEGHEHPGVRVGPIDQVILKEHKSYAGWRAFLCGDPAVVFALRKKVFLAGAKMADIQSDSFLMSGAA
jgi:CDP-4-dehydro-6-deoxyglucose reductase, E3